MFETIKNKLAERKYNRKIQENKAWNARIDATRDLFDGMIFSQARRDYRNEYGKNPELTGEIFQALTEYFATYAPESTVAISNAHVQIVMDKKASNMCSVDTFAALL